jgi:hypothetical protein
MAATAQVTIVDRLAAAFGEAVDVTPEGIEAPHVLLPALELPDPWTPTPIRALTIWTSWPQERPEFLIDLAVVGENGVPPRSSSEVLRLGTTWRGFSFSFQWSGDDPVRAVRLWLGRFTAERT